nr:radical SAM family heme chaperone HemW [Poseidonocella pacifica]
MEDWQNAGFAIYIHWPFCEAKCPYCDFNSHVSQFIDQSRWRRAYLSEIDRLGREFPGRTLSTVFFGGGTPSLMDPDTVGHILERIRATWPISNNFEVTLEANPSSSEVGRFRALRDAGVNRLSLGVQALHDDDLRRLGRLHDVEAALRAISISQQTFPRSSFDLIYGRQGQTLSAWKSELDRALDMAAGHLSLYELTIEPGTMFAKRKAAGKLNGLPDEDLAIALFEETGARTAKAGIENYEVSNYAADGNACEHNLIYWRYGDFAGIGPGAHGRLTVNGLKRATTEPKAPIPWLKSVENGAGEALIEDLGPEDQADEYLMMSLRLTEGMDLDRYHAIAGKSVSQSEIARLEELGLLQSGENGLRITTKGRPLTDAIVSSLIAAG